MHSTDFFVSRGLASSRYPKGLREAAFGLGGTRFDVTVKVVIPAAISGIVSAFLLAFARAVGETMVVALAAGTNPVMTADLRRPSQNHDGIHCRNISKRGSCSRYAALQFTLRSCIYAFSADLFDYAIWSVHSQAISGILRVKAEYPCEPIKQTKTNSAIAG